MIAYLTILLFISHVHAMLNSSRSLEILQSYRGKHFHLAPNVKGQSVNVGIGILIHSMVPLKTLNSHIYMEADIALSWFDPRLKFKNYSEDDRIAIGRESDIFFWRPDIYVKSEKGIIYKQFPEKLSSAWIFPDGRVIYSSRQQVAVFCPTKLNLFPFDKQSCYVKFESYSYNTKQLQLDLENSVDNPVRFGRFCFISQFMLEKYEMTKRSEDYGSSGVFDQIELALYLKRDVHYYIMEYYLPVVGMVSLSFVTFWIHFKATTARVALPTTTFLAMNTMINHIHSSPVLYETAEALEIFLNISIYFIISSLFEYVVVELTDSRWLKVAEKKGITCHRSMPDIEKKMPVARERSFFQIWMENTEEKLMRKHMEQREERHIFDQISRCIFPFSYFTFLLFYFITYFYI